MSHNGTLQYMVSKRREAEPKQHHTPKDVLISSPPQIYPKRYFDVSPTWQQWNKLTAADVHALRTERGFEGQKVFFYQNHPIQFVRVVGLVVEVELIAEGRYTLLTLDDGSGECIVVKIKRRIATKDDHATYPSNTEVDNVDVHVKLGWPSVLLDNKPVQLGDVVKVKGTIDSFRGVRQLELKRMFAVKDTNAEAQAWSEVAKWKTDVLAKPWVLSKADRDKVEAQIRYEERKDREHAKRKREWNAKVSDKRRRHDEKHEAKRRVEEARFNAGALRGSEVILAPWE